MRRWWWLVPVVLLLLGWTTWQRRSRSAVPALATPPAPTAPSASVRAPQARPAQTPSPKAAAPVATQPTPLPAKDGCVTVPHFQPAPPLPAALVREGGELGLWVAVIDPVTLQPVRAVAYHPDGIFPLASTYKQAVLWALLRQVDAGQVSLDTTYNVTPQAQSLGQYPFDGSTARQLAERMIRNSDNTATDLLHRKVGLQAVQNIPDTLGLCRTRLILPTKAWWTAQAGLSPHFTSTKTDWPSLRGEARLRVAQAIDGDAQAQRYDKLQHQLDLYFDHRYNLADDLLVHNLSTPYEFSVLLGREFLYPQLSPHARQIQRNIMRMGYGYSALRGFPIAEWGGKGGNGWKILTYTGYLKTTGGEHVVYAFMLHGSHQDYTMPLTYPAFQWIRSAIKQVLLVGDGGAEVAAQAGKR